MDRIWRYGAGSLLDMPSFLMLCRLINSHTWDEYAVRLSFSRKRKRKKGYTYGSFNSDTNNLTLWAATLAHMFLFVRIYTSSIEQSWVKFLHRHTHVHSPISRFSTPFPSPFVFSRKQSITTPYFIYGQHKANSNLSILTLQQPETLASPMDRSLSPLPRKQLIKVRSMIIADDREALTPPTCNIQWRTCVSNPQTTLSWSPSLSCITTGKKD